MSPTKEHDTTHLDKFSAEELEDILVQLCDSEGVKVSADDDKALKNVGKNALDNIGLGGLGKKIFKKGEKKQEPQPPASPDDPNPPAEPAEPAAPAPAPPRPASDLIRELNVGDKQGLIGVLESVLATALAGDDGNKSGGGNPLFACFGKLLKGGGTKSRNAVESNATQSGEAQTDGAAAPAAPASFEDIKTPEALFKYITSNPAVKTLVISGVQSFLAKALQQNAPATNSS